MNEILTDMFRHNHWANLGLIDFLMGLDDTVLETNVPGTFGTIHATLIHLAGAEEGYLRALIGAERRHPPLYESQPDLATLRDVLDRSGTGFIDFAATVDGDPLLSVVWHGETHQAPASLFLVQAINHATEHRSQIMTAATQAGASPPDFDGWMWDEARRPQQS
jgi:uncharacterized damage-inducible protein DinB